MTKHERAQHCKATFRAIVAVTRAEFAVLKAAREGHVGISDAAKTLRAADAKLAKLRAAP